MPPPEKLMPLDDAPETSVTAPAPDFGPDDTNDFGAAVGGAEGTTSSSADLVSSNEAAPTTSAAPEPTDPNLASNDRHAASAAAPPVAQDNQWTGVREMAEAVGYRFGQEVADDRAALLHLIQRANTAAQSDYYSQLGRQIAPKAAQFQQFLATQAAPAPAASQWDKPEFDPRWASVVERDQATGVVLGKPGTPPEIVKKVNDYIAWKERTDADPEGYIAHVAGRIADERFAGQMRLYQDQQAQQTALADITRANAGWLYAKDEQGRPAVGRDGRPIPSPGGQRYLQHVGHAGKIGIRDPYEQDRYARTMLYAEVAEANQTQTQTAAAQAASPQTRQAQFRPNVNVAQSLPPSQRRVLAAATDPSMAGLSLREALQRDIDAEGLTDADFDMFPSSV